MRRIPTSLQVFGGREHFSASSTVLALVNNVSLWNPSLDQDCSGGEGGGFTTWMTRWGGAVEASKCEGADASLLARQLYGRLALVDSLRMTARVRVATILSRYKALHDLVTFTSVASHLVSVVRRH